MRGNRNMKRKNYTRKDLPHRRESQLKMLRSKRKKLTQLQKKFNNKKFMVLEQK
jgi:hypothetical protein